MDTGRARGLSGCYLPSRPGAGPAVIRLPKGSGISLEPNVFETANAGFAQILYEEYLRDPSSVSPEWQRYFETSAAGLAPEAGGNGHHPSVTLGGRLADSPAPERDPGAAPAAESPQVTPSGPGRADALPKDPQSPNRRITEPPPGAVAITGPAARLVANMNESRSMPTATSFREIAVAILESRRRELNAALRSAGRTEKVSFTHLIGYAVARAAQRHPALTTVYAEVNGAAFRIPGGAANLGIAVDVERKDGSRGLVVPGDSRCRAA